MAKETIITRQDNGNIVISREGQKYRFDNEAHITVFSADMLEIVQGQNRLKINYRDVTAIVYDATVITSINSIVELFQQLIDNVFLELGQGIDAPSVVQLVNEKGQLISAVHPLPTNQDRVYEKDIDESRSDITGWSGDLLTPFNDIITGVSNTDPNPGGIPEPLIYYFKSTIVSNALGLGSETGTFRNVRVSIILSGGIELVVNDDSANNTPYTSQEYRFSADIGVGLKKTIFGLVGIKIEFLTNSPVSITNIFILKTGLNVSLLQGINPRGEFVDIQATNLGAMQVALREYQGDAFGRIRVSNPFTIFDSTLVYPETDANFWSFLTNLGGGFIYDANASSVNLTVPATDGAFVISQTRMRFKYQPLKSHEFAGTGVLATEPGIIKRIGYADYDDGATISIAPKNGIFFQNNEGILSWHIANNGIITESAYQKPGVGQQGWSIDRMDGTGASGFVLDVDAVNIFFIDLEWLGVGAVRCGFVASSGEILLAHIFEHASISGIINVYTRTANLPVSYSIESLGSAGTMKRICSSVISEGGFNPSGNRRTISMDTFAAVLSGDTELMIGMRLKANAFNATVLPKFISVLSSAKNDFLVILSINPTYTGTVTWINKADSTIQWAVNNNNIVTNIGSDVLEFFVSGNANELNEEIDTKRRIGKGLDGTFDEIWVSIQAIGGNDTFRCSMIFDELL